FSSLLPPSPRSPLFPYTTLFRSRARAMTCVSADRGSEPPTSRWPASPTFGHPQPGLRPVEPTCLIVPQGPVVRYRDVPAVPSRLDRKSTRLNSSHDQISYAVFCL